MAWGNAVAVQEALTTVTEKHNELVRTVNIEGQQQVQDASASSAQGEEGAKTVLIEI